jgi:hemerythrin-like domain-containing protein
MATSTLSLLPGGHAAGFDAPFEMLAACHERVERMLGLLERLAAHLAGHGPDGQAAEAARDICRYFDQAAPAHHEDEERHVLPRLRAGGDPALAALADRLQADHRAMAAAWVSLRAELLAVQQGRLPDDWPADGHPPAAWAGFCDRYRAHLRAEDGEAFPAARQGLAPSDEQTMGREMAGRRGLPHDGGPTRP